MNKKRAKFYWSFFATFFVAVVISLYFYLPTVLGDTVYPLKYTGLIVKYSNLYGVDPTLVAAVILQESRFDPNAASGAGAQGLMQFMPATAKTMAIETGRYPNYNIFDPETSIDFGAAHIRDLLLIYDGNLDAALAAYNAGTGNVNSWIAQGILDRIPFKETNNYVKKVKNYQKVYASMYATELGVEPVKVEKQDKTAEVRGFIWSQVFSNIFTGIFGK